MNEQILWSKIASKYHLTLWRRSDVSNRYAITEDSKPPKDGVCGAPRKTVVTHFRMRILKIEAPTNITELAGFFPGNREGAPHLIVGGAPIAERRGGQDERR